MSAFQLRAGRRNGPMLRSESAVPEVLRAIPSERSKGAGPGDVGASGSHGVLYNGIATDGASGELLPELVTARPLRRDFPEAAPGMLVQVSQPNPLGNRSQVPTPLQHGSPGERNVNGRMAALFACLTGVALNVALAYDLSARWCHTLRFERCKRDLQRIQEVLLKGDGDVPLCPCCVNPIKPAMFRSRVVFICGHGFHLDCANRCFLENQQLAGSCPLCILMGMQAACAQPRVTVQGAEDLLDEVKGCVGKQSVEPVVSPIGLASAELRSFMLASLRRKYQDILSEACIQRWESCHIEIWLSELVCPKYTSLFSVGSDLA